MIRIVCKRAVARSTFPVPLSLRPAWQLQDQSFFHSSRMAENQLIIGGLAVLGTAVTLRYAVAAYETYKQNQPAVTDQPPAEEANQEEVKSKTGARAEPRAEAQSSARKTTSSSGNPADSLFSSWFARNFYDGGFEEKMTKREAALILGVRESAAVERVKEAHRRMLILNHPDKGGSVFITAKINEAKDLLLKGKQ
ncbi:hypothetical protein EON64_10435 [archaeon]|nr:MAG: hypothetical protein EON64_10435 [archaeon]